MLIAFSVAPSGSPDSGSPDSGSGSGDSGPGSDSGTDSGTDSVSAAVADAVRIVRESGLPHQTDSMFTTIEGEWDECMDVVKRACEAVGRHGSRVSLVLKADIRPGRTGEMQAKVARLEAALEAGASSSDTPMRPDGP